MIQDPAVILDKIHLGPETAADILDRDERLNKLKLFRLLSSCLCARAF